VSNRLGKITAECWFFGMAFSKEEFLNKVVARFANGNVIKGTTDDFFPEKDLFHVSVFNKRSEAKPVQISTNDLKALFFVKDLRGDPRYVYRNEFDPEHPTIGVKIRVEFKDGEVLVGTTTGYQPGRSVFLILPADADSNNERCYLVVEATKEIRLL
jgi:hypothetical protein